MRETLFGLPILVDPTLRPGDWYLEPQPAVHFGAYLHTALDFPTKTVRAGLPLYDLLRGRWCPTACQACGRGPAAPDFEIGKSLWRDAFGEVDLLCADCSTWAHRIVTEILLPLTPIQPFDEAR